MLFCSVVIKITCIINVIYLTTGVHCYKYVNDQSSTRANTLFDDADDIQRQLDNEARDRLKYGRFQLPTIWVLHLPSKNPGMYTYMMPRYSRTAVYQKRSTKTSITTMRANHWDYSNQNEWFKQFPQCGGQSQSPIDLPTTGLVNVKGCKCLSFINYDVIPRSLTLHYDGMRYILTGVWNLSEKPVIYGGAAYGRRYIFHSLVIHWPSEHKIGGMMYPFETQALHISAEYNTLEEAIKAAPRDPQSILGVVNIYMFRNRTGDGLLDILKSIPKVRSMNASVLLHPLSHFSPPMEEYVCYQGSLTIPPCTESVLWFVRARSLPLSRDTLQLVNSLLDEDDSKKLRARQPHPLNDRKVYFANREQTKPSKGSDLVVDASRYLTTNI